MKHRVLVLVVLSLNSCGSMKEEDTYTRAYIINQTTHSVMILPHRGGSVRPTDTIKLGPGQQEQLCAIVTRGKTGLAGFENPKLQIGADDSVLVVFDDRYTVAHYVTKPAQLRAKYIEYPTPRSLMYYLNYEYTYEDIDKYHRESYYRYRFVEADYQFAAQ